MKKIKEAIEFIKIHHRHLLLTSGYSACFAITSAWLVEQGTQGEAVALILVLGLILLALSVLEDF